MPAMNMPYRVDSDLLLDAAQPGDRIEFSVRDSGAGAKIIEIKKKS